MKKLITTVCIVMATLLVHAQSEKFVAAMQKNIAQIDAAFATPDALINLANNFERIGNAEKNQWLPYYYAAYCQVNYAYMQKDATGNDALADKAQRWVALADSLQPNNSEISCVKSMIASIRMLVNPQQRFMEYGALSEKELKNAKEQDPTNPRPYLLKGQTLKYTPEQYGGGCKKAMTELEKAAEKFAAFKVASNIHPNWGGDYTNKLIAECK
ncbi:hypothetical protein ACFOWM_07035 [Ferruginibacter yonginensis]|uniref:Sel1 repeat family protein n=1 Tax=Ferruginibacter yonginensis TaxID=1310416 RepID=A0ABV8QUB0_9BACT